MGVGVETGEGAGAVGGRLGVRRPSAMELLSHGFLCDGDDDDDEVILGMY